MRYNVFAFAFNPLWFFAFGNSLRRVDALGRTFVSGPFCMHFFQFTYYVTYGKMINIVQIMPKVIQYMKRKKVIITIRLVSALLHNFGNKNYNRTNVRKLYCKFPQFVI